MSFDRGHKVEKGQKKVPEKSLQHQQSNEPQKNVPSLKFSLEGWSRKERAIIKASEEDLVAYQGPYFTGD